MRFAADENFNNNILRGLFRKRPSLDIVRIQDAGLSGYPDPYVLGWAANENRILLTHDAATITKYAYERVAGGSFMPGVFEVDITAPIGAVIEDILLIIELSTENEWENRIGYIPL